jgi:hypothetical protein
VVKVAAATLSSRPPLDPECLAGLPGDVVRSCAGETEADPAAVLAAYRNETGNLIGYGPFLMIARYRYPPLFHDVISGSQDEGRKSTAVEEVEEITRLVNPAWFAAIRPASRPPSRSPRAS